MFFIFGNQEKAVIPSELTGLANTTLNNSHFSGPLILLKQIHSTQGLIIFPHHLSIPLWTIEGDYLITQNPSIGLAVATADCLPIILIDETSQTIAIAHVGWKGLFAGIVEKVIERMVRECNAHIKNIRITIGPAAGGCCYEITPEFLNNIPYNRRKTKAIRYDYHKDKKGHIFFDLVTYLKESLIIKGCHEKFITTEQHNCTICNTQFCSYRRSQQSSFRQLSIVSLK